MDRIRHRARHCAFAAAILFCASVACFGTGKDYILYVGTYTTNGSKGIYAYHYDGNTDRLSPIGLAAETENPSFLVVDSGSTHLYAVNETQKYRNESSGGLTAFAIDRKTGMLKQLDEVASRGADPCFISFDRSGKYLLVANYTGGNVAVFPVLADGRIGEGSSVLDDEGVVGPNKERQEKAHAHWIQVSARNRFAYVSDLGLDRVLIYNFDATRGKLSRGQPASAKDFLSATLSPGTGPRHVVFSPDGEFMYVLGELDSTVTVFANDHGETYRAIQKISALPQGFSGKNDAAEIAVHPNGKFLYASNRGDDSIVVFAIDGGTGRLTFMQRVPTHGKAPRNFVLSPTGEHLFAANQDSGNIVEFRIDQTTGRLNAGIQVASVPSPVCLVFAPVD